jgi:hypothetical protein
MLEGSEENGFADEIFACRECWCAQYISSVSPKVPDSSCNLPCEGNSSQICGGDLKLTVYQVKSATKGAGTKGVREAPVAVLALGIAMGVLLCWV